MPKIDTRCLECSHEFPNETLIMKDEVSWGCPKCRSSNIELIIPEKGYKYETTKVKYEEGNHD